jgi:hypothetical protein
VIPTHSASTRPLAQQYRVVRHGTRVSRKVTAPPTHGAAQREEAHGEDRLAQKHRVSHRMDSHNTVCRTRRVLLNGGDTAQELMVEQRSGSRYEAGRWALRVFLAPVLLACCDGVLRSMSRMVSVFLFLLSVQRGVEHVAFARQTT